VVEGWRARLVGGRTAGMVGRVRGADGRQTVDQSCWSIVVCVAHSQPDDLGDDDIDE